MTHELRKRAEGFGFMIFPGFLLGNLSYSGNHIIKHIPVMVICIKLGLLSDGMVVPKGAFSIRLLSEVGNPKLRGNLVENLLITPGSPS